MPGDVQRDTPFGGGVNDGTYTIQNGLVRRFLQRWEGPSIGVVIGNDNASVATGGGGACAIVKGMIDVTGHEIGHAFASLGDEYAQDPGGAPGPAGRATGVVETQVVAATLIRGNQKEDMRKKAPWKHWIDLGAENWTLKPVDLYEGADSVPFDAWRPQPDCKMRTSSSRFCAVCMEQMMLAIYRSVRPIDELQPEGDTIELKAGETLVLRVATLKPKSNYLDVDFTLLRTGDIDADDSTVTRGDEKPEPISRKWVTVPDGRAAYIATQKKMKSGVYKAKVSVKDPTVWVQQKDRTSLSQTHTWTVRVSE
ncbi:MAG: M64 family metallopeptidase, partial [Planctomycetota bacterium]|jgi:hypothetical protein